MIIILEWINQSFHRTQDLHSYSLVKLLFSLWKQNHNIIRKVVLIKPMKEGSLPVSPGWMGQNLFSIEFYWISVNPFRSVETSESIEFLPEALWSVPLQMRRLDASWKFEWFPCHISPEYLIMQHMESNLKCNPFPMARAQPQLGTGAGTPKRICASTFVPSSSPDDQN